MSMRLGIVVLLSAVVAGHETLAEPSGDREKVFAPAGQAGGQRELRSRADEDSVAPQLDREVAVERAAEADDRWPVPDAQSRDAAVSRVRDVFSGDYSSAKTIQAKAALAKQLVQQASVSQVPAERWGLLRESAGLAIDAGDVSIATEAMEMLIVSFRIDRYATQLDGFQRLMRTTNTTQAIELGRPAIALANEALQDGQLHIAKQAVALVASVARKARAPDLVKAGNTLRQAVRQREALDAHVASLRERLERDPNDRDASRELGLALYLNAISSEEGLRLLARSDDPRLSRLAKLELAGDESGGDGARLALADGWSDWAVSATGSLRSQAEAKALRLYLAVSPSLQGLEGARVAKRIGELQKGIGLKGEATPLIKVPMGERTGGSALFLNGLCNGVKFTVNGKEWPNAIYYAPKDNSTGIIRFTLPGTHRRLQGHAGIFSLPDTRPSQQPGAAFIFSVLADGREVWRSQPLTKRDQIVAFSFDISGARSLELHTKATGIAGIPWAAWLDPELVE